MYLVTAKQMQQMDKETIESFGIPGRILMENAGRGAVEMMFKHYLDMDSKKVCVLAGSGNNGGDAFVIARYLIQKGITTNTLIISPRMKIKGDALANLELLEKLYKESDLGHIKIISDVEALYGQTNLIRHTSLFVDGILGTGLNSDVRGLFKEVINMINRTKKPVFSIDIPSGLNADTGMPMGTCIKAEATATFAFAKAGHMIYPGKSFTGKLGIVDIGIPGFISDRFKPLLHMTENKMLRPLFPPRNPDGHKGSFGHLLVIAGSVGKTGAAALASNAAVACGTGLVTLGIAESLNSSMEPQVIEPMTYPLPETKNGFLSEAAMEIILELAENKTAIALGPGLCTKETTKRLIKKIIKEIDLPMILDADALNSIKDDPFILKKRNGKTIITPHPGEMARLTRQSGSEVQADRIKCASTFALKFNTIVVLKGAATITALPDGQAFICPTGNPGMASGGMGDVLTGIISGLAAQGFSLENSAIAGVHLHGACGDKLADYRGAYGFRASELIHVLPEVMSTTHRHLRSSMDLLSIPLF